MKILITTARILVGLLFIFSGLVKAIDPLGLSYKMQEFFELWGMTQFNNHTLWLSVVMIAFEIIAGVALLLGWRMKLFMWLLLLLILFFTFLTGYAYLSGKFKNCGCFGDCIPITPLTSFLKDVVLTLLILVLFKHKDKIKPVFSSKLSMGLILLCALFSFGIQWYMLNYLPLFDCLAYKKGNNIKEKMQMPVGSVPDSFAIRFVYEKEGKDYEFAAEELPADLASYKYKSRVDKLIRKGNAEPPIKGFTLSGITDADSTDVVLSQPQAILLFCEDFSQPVTGWKDDFARLYASAKAKNIPVYVITGRMDEAKQQFASTPFSDIQIFTCDNTAIRTAARTNPCVYLLKEGTIVDKQSYRRISRIENLIK
ncbi:MAG TPA: BT_3928 family protein [Chitinophagaceae bacterium]|nr:BT_3928 family protein [Chitinophagaceae bacterium]